MRHHIKQSETYELIEELSSSIECSGLAFRGASSKHIEADAPGRDAGAIFAAVAALPFGYVRAHADPLAIASVTAVRLPL